MSSEVLVRVTEGGRVRVTNMHVCASIFGINRLIIGGYEEISLTNSQIHIPAQCSMRIKLSHIHPRKNERNPVDTGTKIGRSSTLHFHW